MKKGCSSGKLQAPNNLKLPKKENYGTNVHEVRGSKKVIPHVLQEAGFTWDYPHISEALSALIED